MVEERPSPWLLATNLLICQLPARPRLSREGGEAVREEGTLEILSRLQGIKPTSNSHFQVRGGMQ